jgi:hypothetical protein
MAPPVGKNKVKAITQHKGVLPHHRSHPRGKAADTSAGLTFRFEDPLQLPKQNFNVLYVQTPRIGLLQAPFFRAFAETCQETADMVKPMLRLGIRETSLFDKCPYYE